jgi:hypothetical protein
MGYLGRLMEEYRAYVIGRLGHIINRVDFLCSNEDEARKVAKDIADVHAIELWRAGRFIERFDPERPPKKERP